MLIQTSTLIEKPELETNERIASPCAWIWRGKVRSRWESLGFDSETFDLFMKMKGARTRSNLLYALSNPRDRLQLAQELGVDWKVVNYHIGLLSRCALVYEDSALGRTRMYRLTALGESLLRLLGEFGQTIDRER